MTGNLQSAEAIPEPHGLIETVLAASTNSRSRLHGPDHWNRVALAGHVLLRRENRADPTVVFLFALFHDAMRQNDCHDPEHGARGAALARELRGEFFEVSDAQMNLLVEACTRHTDGRVSRDPTIGACWDADRLDLWRVGTAPNPAFLSTAAAPSLIGWAKRYNGLGGWDWDGVCRMFGLPAAPPGAFGQGEQLLRAEEFGEQAREEFRPSSRFSGKALARERYKAGLSLGELAERVGLSKWELMNIELERGLRPYPKTGKIGESLACSREKRRSSGSRDGPYQALDCER